MNEETIVSIICNTYNHEKYIRDALNSFVMQKTDFQYEVLIHDDASTDNTPAIIKEFETRYPDIIKPIYQKENQYSKGLAQGDPFLFMEEYQYTRIKGKYVALCEGDDYWIDPYKLQKQFDAMEEHPEIDICAHSAYIVQNGKKIGRIAPRKEKTIIPVTDIILGGGGFIATNSILYRTDIRKRKPEFMNCVHLDYSLQIWGALRGGLLYLPDYMACYRAVVPGGWTSHMLNNTSAEIKHIKRINNMLEVLNKDTNGKYAGAIYTHIAENQIDILEKEHRFNEIKSEGLITYYKKLSLRRRLVINIKRVLQAMGFYNK